jgi:hypothetical protein
MVRLEFGKEAGRIVHRMTPAKARLLRDQLNFAIWKAEEWGKHSPADSAENHLPLEAISRR